MADSVLTAASLKAELTGLTAATMPWNGAKIGLYTNSRVPQVSDVLADYTQPTFTGYALSPAVTWGVQTVDALGRAVQLSDKKEFQPTAPVTEAANIKGAILVNGAGDTLLAVLPFDDTVGISDQDDVCVVVFPAIAVQPTGDSPLVES